MTRVESLFQWTGGALFAGAAAFCGYSFLAVWSRAGVFDGPAIAIDGLLFALFAAHHSVFAREPVKRWLTRVVPDRLQRSVYVWIASLLLIVVCASWQAVGGDLYHVHGWRAAAHAGVQTGGLLIIVSALRTIDALELAGIHPHAATPSLQIAGPYRWVRHPLYLGWLLATAGAAHMTGDRLTFAGISAVYVILAMPWEERSLLRSMGARYAEYQKTVRWRVLPYIY